MITTTSTSANNSLYYNPNITVDAKYNIKINDKEFVLTGIEARQLYYALQNSLGLGINAYIPFAQATGYIPNSTGNNPNPFPTVTSNIAATATTGLLSSTNGTTTFVYSNNQ